MLDTSGVSLSTSDPNPSIDQYDDGGSSADWSSVVNTAGQWGLEIASIVNNNSRPAYPVTGSGAPYPSYVPGATAPSSKTTKLLLIALVLGGGYVFVKSLSKN